MKTHLKTITINFLFYFCHNNLKVFNMTIEANPSVNVQIQDGQAIKLDRFDVTKFKFSLS